MMELYTGPPVREENDIFCAEISLVKCFPSAMVLYLSIQQGTKAAEKFPFGLRSGHRTQTQTQLSQVRS